LYQIDGSAAESYGYKSSSFTVTLFELLLASSFYHHHDGDSFPPPFSHVVADGNQVTNPPSDVEAEEGWFDDGQLGEAVKRNPSKVSFGGIVLWTYLDLQGKPHLLVPELILPLSDLHPFPSPNTPVSTGPSVRSLDASGMSRLTIVLICGTFVLTFCGTYCSLILICLLIQ
jgi:hypothetical protein